MDRFKFIFMIKLIKNTVKNVYWPIYDIDGKFKRIQIRYNRRPFRILHQAKNKSEHVIFILHYLMYLKCQCIDITCQTFFKAPIYPTGRNNLLYIKDRFITGIGEHAIQRFVHLSAAYSVKKNWIQFTEGQKGVPHVIHSNYYTIGLKCIVETSCASK